MLWERPAKVTPFLLLFPVAATTAALTWLLNGSALRRWSRTAGMHWSERARRLHPIQLSAVYGLLIAGGCAGFVGHWLLGDGLSAPLIFGLAGLIGGLLGIFPGIRACWPEVTFRGHVSACVKNWGFVLGLILAAHLLTWGMGEEWNARSAAMAGAFLGLYLWYVTVGWLWVMRRLGGLTAVPPDIAALIRERAAARNVPVKETLFLEDFRALAFALPIQRSLLLTPKLVGILTPEELRSVVDHELGHLGEPRAVLVGRVVGAMAYAPLPLLGVAAKWHGMKGVLACYLTWFVIAQASKRLARAMEVRADSFATDRPDVGAIYASALEKIYAENFVPASGIARNQVHPDLYDRMLAAGIQPDFERPKKPAHADWTVIVWAMLFFGLMILRASLDGF